MVNYNSIFLEKTGQGNVTSPWDNTRINGALDNASYIISRNYATPWSDFDSVPDKYQYAVTMFAAVEYWWAKSGEAATKFDTNVGGGTGQRSGILFNNALRMISVLQEELGTLGLVEEGSGDILIGDLVIRSRDTGRLVPYATDVRGNWLS
jgi:hypothetical protein